MRHGKAGPHQADKNGKEVKISFGKVRQDDYLEPKLQFPMKHQEQNSDLRNHHPFVIALNLLLKSSNHSLFKHMQEHQTIRHGVNRNYYQIFAIM